MKKLRVLLSVLLVICMVVGFAPMHGTASAAREDWEWYWSEEYRNNGNWNGWSYTDGWYELSDKWYQVDFNTVKVPVEVNASGTVSNGAATAAGSTVQMVGTSFSYFYNEWAGTLIIRGTGEMPSFSEEYPAPWANLKDKAARVIFERNITKISSNAFVDFSRLRSVVLPATLKAIDPDAFLWSDETRELKTFQKLERIEYSGDLNVLDKVLTAASIKDLLDAKIVKVTEKAIQDEIWQLTWYRIRKPVRVKYDRAGRPILIERVDKDGYFRTEITWDDTLADPNVHSVSQPTSPDTVAAGKSFSRDVIEKRETYSVTPDGVEHLYEKEKNDLGQTTYSAAFHLDNGVITGGTQTFADETGVTKTGTLKAIQHYGEETYRFWENVLANGGGLEQMIEALDKFGRVKWITTDRGDNIVNIYNEKTGLLDSRTVTESGEITNYTYNYKDNILQSVQADKIDSSTGTVTNTNTVKYTYNDNGSMNSKVQTEGTTTVTTQYNLYNRATKEVITDSGNVQYVYEYAYDSNGVVTQRTVKDKDGKVVGLDTFENGHIVKSVREMPAAAGTKSVETTTYKYTPEGVLSEKAVSTVTAKLAAAPAKTEDLSLAIASLAAEGGETKASAESGEGTGVKTVSTKSLSVSPEDIVKTSLLDDTKQTLIDGLNLLGNNENTNLKIGDLVLLSANKVTESYDDLGNPKKTETNDILGEGVIVAKRGVEIQDGQQVALNTFIDDNTGDEPQSDSFKKETNLDVNKKLSKVNTLAIGFNGHMVSTADTFNSNEQPVTSVVEESNEGGPTIVDVEESNEGGPTIVESSNFIPQSSGDMTKETFLYDRDTKMNLGYSIDTIPVAEKEPVVEGIDKTAPEDKATIEDEGEEKPDEKKPDVIVEEKKEATDKTEPEDEPTVEGEGDEEADENKAEIIIEDKKEDTVPEADPKEEGSVAGDEENEPEEMKAEIIVEDKKEETVPEEKKEEAAPEDKKEEAAPEDKKEETVVEDKKEETAPEDKKEETAPEDKKEETVVEDKKEETVVEDKKEETVPEVIPEEATPKAEPVVDNSAVEEPQPAPAAEPQPAPAPASDPAPAPAPAPDPAPAPAPAPDPAPAPAPAPDPAPAPAPAPDPAPAPAPAPDPAPAPAPAPDPAPAAEPDPVEQDEHKIICPNCGTHFSDIKCPNCGWELES